MPNPFVGTDGPLHASAITTGSSLGNGKPPIFNHDGVATISGPAGRRLPIQPLASAGNRIACGS